MNIQFVPSKYKSLGVKGSSLALKHDGFSYDRISTLCRAQDPSRGYVSIAKKDYSEEQLAQNEKAFLDRARELDFSQLSKEEMKQNQMEIQNKIMEKEGKTYSSIEEIMADPLYNKVNFKNVRMASDIQHENKLKEL